MTIYSGYALIINIHNSDSSSNNLKPASSSNGNNVCNLSVESENDSAFDLDPTSHNLGCTKFQRIKEVEMSHLTIQSQ